MSDSDVTAMSSNRFVERLMSSGDERSVQAYMEALGVSDAKDITAMSAEERAERLGLGRDSGRIGTNTVAIRELAAAKSTEAQPLPVSYYQIKEGVSHYKSGDADIGIYRKGDNYIIYDYAGGKVTRTLTADEMQKRMWAIKDELKQRASAPSSENKNTAPKDGERSALRGYAEDGKGIYESNFPVGTPKAAKSKRILEYIQNVWSKKPIDLIISNGEKTRTIKAQFDPTYDPSLDVKTDASKIAAGNRHGTHSEQRVTLDLADDYYRIASEAKYNYSKLETGKTLETHKDVIMWHYFVNDIYFAEQGQTELTPYTVTINVKEKPNGDYVYSFNAEKESSTRRTLHADVNTVKGVNGELFIDSISHSASKNNPSSLNSSEKSRRALTKDSSKVAKSGGNASVTSTKVGNMKVSAVALAAENRAITAAAERIAGYKQMTDVNKDRVRAAIRTARAEGLSDADVQSIGLFTARSGMNVLVTDKLGAKENAHYDGQSTIYVNSKIDANRTYGQLLAHEMWHKILKTTGDRGVSKKLLRDAWKRLPAAEREKLVEDYKKHYTELGYSEKQIADEKILEDEVAAAYVEKIFTKPEAMKALLSERPALKERITTFFEHKSGLLGSDERLSGAAKKWLGKYTRLFDRVAAIAESQTSVENVAGVGRLITGSQRSAISGNGNVDNDLETRYNRKTNKTDEGVFESGRSRSENTEILEGRDLPAVGRRKDISRKYSNDPETIYRWLVDCQNHGGIYEGKKAGSSGWLDATFRGKPFVLGSIQSVFRDLRGIELSERDSAGRILQSDLREKLKDTIFKDEYGRLLSLYHWTDRIFITFSNGDIGFHFGTLNAAYRRYSTKEKRSSDISTYKEVYLNIKNPAIIDFDPMSWSAFTTIYLLNRYKYVSNNELSTFVSETIFNKKPTYEDAANQKFRELLKKKGYDGIIYRNDFEGDISVIAFSPDQIITVAENGIDVRPDVKKNGGRSALSREDTKIDSVDAKAMVDRVGGEFTLGMSRTQLTELVEKQFAAIPVGADAKDIQRVCFNAAGAVVEAVRKDGRAFSDAHKVYRELFGYRERLKFSHAERSIINADIFADVRDELRGWEMQGEGVGVTLSEFVKKAEKKLSPYYDFRAKTGSVLELMQSLREISELCDDLGKAPAYANLADGRDYTAEDAKSRIAEILRTEYEKRMSRKNEAAETVMSAKTELKAEPKTEMEYKFADTWNKTTPYTSEEIASIKRDEKNDIATSYDDVKYFLLADITHKIKRLFLGKIKPDANTVVKKDTGIDVSGKSIVLSKDDVTHLFNRHGDEKKEALLGQEAINVNNFEEILDSIFEPDSVEKEIDGNNVITLIFHKESKNKVTAVTISSDKKKALTLKSARITKKKQHISPPSDVQAPNPTPKSEKSMNTVSDNSITDSEKKVNTFSKKRCRSALSSNGIDNDGETRYNKNKTNQESLNNGNENTEILDGKHSSLRNGNDRSGNYQGPEGNDPEKTFNILGECQESRRRTNKRRAGSSGVLQGSYISAREYFSGDILRNLRQTRLKAKDSAGRIISAENRKKLADTVLKDFDGTVLSLLPITSKKDSGRSALSA